MVLILILILTLILLIIVRVSALLPSGGRSKVEDFSINFGPEALGTPCRSYPSAGVVVDGWLCSQPSPTDAPPSTGLNGRPHLISPDLNDRP